MTPQWGKFEFEFSMSPCFIFNLKFEYVPLHYTLKVDVYSNIFNLQNILDIVQDCYIEGAVDVVCGNGKSLYQVNQNHEQRCD